MDEIPERHPTVPSTATWSDGMQCWEDSGFDEAGRRHGEYRSFRADGSLRICCGYTQGTPSGRFRIHHPNGDVAREGQLLDGDPHGLVLAYRSDAPSPETLRPCCVPEAARLLHAEYDRGQLLSERFFDAEGRLLLSDGSVAPTRPAVLPETAVFDEINGFWLTSEQRAAGTLLRVYGADARLVREEEFCAEWRACVRWFGRDSRVRQEEHFDEAKRLHGARLVRYVDDEISPYLPLPVAEERSEFEHGEPVGTLELRLHSGETLRYERGPAFGGESEFAHPVFGEREPATTWSALVEELAAARLPRHALCAAARAAVSSNSLQILRRWLAVVAAPVRPERAQELAESLESEERPSVSAILTGLLLGAEPSVAFRLLAKVLPKRGHAAYDFIEAALLLAPEASRSYWIRAMMRLELGRVSEALDDAERLRQDPTSASLSEFVRDYVRIVFPRWRFMPADEAITSSFEGLPEAPQQPLAAIRRSIQIYATRLFYLRQAVSARSDGEPEAAWLPPALPELLPDGPLPLERYSATIVDSSDDGDESSEVEVDETLDLADMPLLQLQACARCEWFGLTWLCWAAGLTSPALPTELRPPANFADAASRIITRAARANDTVTTGGVRARLQGEADFQWEGFAIDSLSPSLAKLVFHEYFEGRALFLWLCFAENRSPFQSDLRRQ
jgi:hypothetical protein